MTLNNMSMTPPTDVVLAIVRGELSSKRRWFYRLTLMLASVMLAVVLSLWTTEPGPLPTRLHIAFAGMAGIALGWIGVLSWVLTRRNCPTAIDRIATAWMSMLASGLFFVAGLSIAVIRADVKSASFVGITGVFFLTTSVLLLTRAYAMRTRLKAKLVELQNAVK